MKALTCNSTLDDLERWLRALDVRITDCVCIASLWYVTVSGVVREGDHKGAAIMSTGTGSGVGEAIMSALTEWHSNEAAVKAGCHG